MQQIVKSIPSAFIITTNGSNNWHTTKVNVIHLATFFASDSNPKVSRSKAIMQFFEPLKGLSNFITIFKSGKAYCFILFKFNFLIAFIELTQFIHLANHLWKLWTNCCSLKKDWFKSIEIIKAFRNVLIFSKPQS